MARLQARISSLGRAADRQHLYNHSPSISSLHKVTDSPQLCLSAPSPASSPKKLQTTTSSPPHAHSTHLSSPTHAQTCLSPSARSYLKPTSALHLSESRQTCDWLQSSSIDSSLDLPESVKATLREALSKQPWESLSHSISSLPDTVDHSWQGLSASDATVISDNSFNPLTYMVDRESDRNPHVEGIVMERDEGKLLSNSRRESVSTLVGQEEQADMSSLTGMLKFVNQTLAMQEDPSLWRSINLPHT